MTTATLEHDKAISPADAIQNTFSYSDYSSAAPQVDTIESKFQEALKLITPDNLKLIQTEPPAEWLSEDWS